jgi:hypothetical protein
MTQIRKECYATNILLKSCFFGKRTVSLGSLDFKIEEWTTGSEVCRIQQVLEPDTHFGVFLSFLIWYFFAIKKCFIQLNCPWNNL